MSLVKRHVDFLAALRSVGIGVSTAEGIDAMRAVEIVGIDDRDDLRLAFSSCLIKRRGQQHAFDELFDLYFPAKVGSGGGLGPTDQSEAESESASGLDRDVRDDRGHQVQEIDGPQQLAELTDEVTAAMAAAMAGGSEQQLRELASQAVQRYGQIAGRGEGQQRWSTYNVMQRFGVDALVQRLMRELSAEMGNEAAARRLAEQRVRDFEARVDAEVRRRAAEVRGAEHVAKHSVRNPLEQLDFMSLRRSDLEEMRREIQPLAYRLASRLSREQRSKKQRGPLDFRRTVRSSMSSGGVPLRTYHRPKREHRNELVILCDVSGSVANFANFTLLLVFALAEQFARVRAFTFVDEVTEVSHYFKSQADPTEVMAELAASAQHASLTARTNYGRAFTTFAQRHPDALTPKSTLLVLGDARSNHGDLALPVVRDLARAARRSFWLNPEHPRSWDTGDSEASAYGEIVDMVECRNLTQLAEFVHDLSKSVPQR